MEFSVDVVAQESIILSDVSGGEVKVTIDTSEEVALAEGDLLTEAESRLVLCSDLESSL